MEKNRQILLKERPRGLPCESHFEFVEVPVPKPGPSEVLVRTLYLTVDPYMRGRMSEAKSYASPWKIGQVFGRDAVGQVVESAHSGFRAGDYVLGSWGWQTYAAVAPDSLTKLDPGQAPITTALGVLGMPGLTAYFGMLEIGRPKEGETVVVSAAAGAVGSVAGQIAKIYGARVIGIAGSDEKIDYLREELGFDDAINYKTSANLYEDLKKAAYRGVDVYFDNVGGKVSDAVLQLINRNARIPICGQIAHYNETEPEPGPRVGRLLLSNTALMQGFLVSQYASRYPEGLKQLAEWIKAGKIKYREHIVEGFENTPKAFLGLFSGENIGKLLVKVG